MPLKQRAEKSATFARHMTAKKLHLQQLTLVNFKNYVEAELSFSPQVNCFVGNNGEGKTNLLDAIYYLSFCKSYFNPIDSQNIRHNEAFLLIQGNFEKGEQHEKIHCGIKRGQKKQFRRNKKEYTRLADHIGLLPLVMVSPADINLVYEGSEVRRKFIDGVVSQFNKAYLDDLLQYNRVQSHRNALLKQFAQQRMFDATSLELWDMQLDEFGSRIYQHRKAFLNDFIPLFREHYTKLSEGREVPDLEYQSKLAGASLLELLEQAREKDRVVQYTTVGIHKDDLVFRLGDYPIKKFGSQGQQKSYLIALKLAQYDYIRQQKETTPLLLLDDIFDKLDAHRVKALMNRVSSGSFGQIFITDTDRERLDRLFADIDIDCRIFNIVEGQAQHQTAENHGA